MTMPVNIFLRLFGFRAMLNEHRSGIFYGMYQFLNARKIEWILFTDAYRTSRDGQRYNEQQIESEMRHTHTTEK